MFLTGFSDDLRGGSEKGRPFSISSQVYAAFGGGNCCENLAQKVIPPHRIR
jgi:hypothetical protein